jgi:branched-chain amino acid transport system substrate-binding protein
MRNKSVLVVLMVLLAVGMLFLAACGSGDTGARDDSSSAASPAPVATGEPLIIGFDGGFTGFMAMDVALAEQGILTAIDMAGGQWNGRPIEYKKADNASDPVQAVDKARQLVESDGIQFMAGPIFSPSAAAVTDYLAKSGGGIPQCSIVGQPSDNLKTANGLAFFPNGLYGSQGYYFGKYCAEELGYKTANCLNYEDTAARQLQAGFDKGFKEGGGQILSTQYVPIDAVDFSAYLTKMKPADCTYFWVFGNGAAPFVKQYNDYGLEAPLVMAMCNNFSEPQLRDLGELGVGMVGGDFYTPEIDNELNKAFVEAYKAKWDGEYPAPQAYGGYQAVQLFLAGVEATGGDTTPAALIEAMSTISLDMPAGKMTMQPYKDGFIPTRDWYIQKTEQVGDRIAWVPVKVIEQVTLGE